MNRSPLAAAADVKWRLLSQTAEYALRVVLYLAAHAQSAPISAAEAAAELAIPDRYLARVLNALTRAGVLTSTRGAQGGFQLAVRPDQLTLADVVASFDAVGDPPHCLLRSQRCGNGEPCIAHEQWHDVATHVRTFFQTTTIGDLLTADVPAAAVPIT